MYCWSFAGGICTLTLIGKLFIGKFSRQEVCLNSGEEAAMDDEDAGEGDLHVEPEDHLLHPPRVHPSQQQRFFCSQN